MPRWSSPAFARPHRSGETRLRRLLLPSSHLRPPVAAPAPVPALVTVDLDPWFGPGARKTAFAVWLLTVVALVADVVVLGVGSDATIAADLGARRDDVLPVLRLHRRPDGADLVAARPAYAVIPRGASTAAHERLGAVTGALLVLLPAVAACLLAVSARVPSLVSTVLIAYLAFVAEMVGTALVLSAFQSVTEGWVAVAGVLVVVAASATWVLRGRPGIPLAGAAGSLRELAASRLTVVFLVVVAALLGYELVLGVTVPPNNWDSLWYHLPRAVAWLQNHGYGWIQNAPTDILNTRQPVAEQELLFLFAATGTSHVYALPQFLAELAILVAVFGAARRLGFGVPASACSAALLATFSIVSLEASTAQNDLVAASFPVVAVCLLLGETRVEQALAGVAVGIGLGVKLTTVFVLPVVALLAVARGARPTVRALSGCLAGLVTVGMWGYVLNQEHTGRILGQGQLSLDVTTSPSYPSSAIAAVDLLYETLDLGFLSDRRIHLLALAGVLVGSRRRRPGRGAAGGHEPWPTAGAPRCRSSRRSSSSSPGRSSRGPRAGGGTPSAGCTGRSARRTGRRARTTRRSGRSAPSRSSASRP